MHICEKNNYTVHVFYTFQAFGDASVAQLVLGTSTFHSVNWAWGIGVAMGVWVAGGVSGRYNSPLQTIIKLFINQKKEI